MHAYPVLVELVSNRRHRLAREANTRHMVAVARQARRARRGRA